MHVEDKDNMDNEEIKSLRLLIEAMFHTSAETYEELKGYIQSRMEVFKNTDHPDILYFQAMMLEAKSPYIVKEYETKYLELISKSAKGGCKEAQYIYANRLYENQEYKKAVEFYKKSALQGYASSQWCYGIDLFNGIEGVLGRDKEKGLFFIELSAYQLYEYALDFLIESYKRGSIEMNTSKYKQYQMMLEWI